MLVEGVETIRPELPELLQPGIEGRQLAAFQPIEPLLPVRAHADEAGLAQLLEMLRHARLTEAGRLHKISRRPLAVPQELEQATSVRLGYGFEWAHGFIFTISYITVKEFICRAGHLKIPLAGYVFLGYEFIRLGFFSAEIRAVNSRRSVQTRHKDTRKAGETRPPHYRAPVFSLYLTGEGGRHIAIGRSAASQ